MRSIKVTISDPTTNEVLDSDVFEVPISFGTTVHLTNESDGFIGTLEIGKEI